MRRPLEFEGYYIQQIPGAYQLRRRQPVFREIALIACDQVIRLGCKSAGDELIVIRIGRNMG